MKKINAMSLYAVCVNRWGYWYIFLYRNSTYWKLLSDTGEKEIFLCFENQNLLKKINIAINSEIVSYVDNTQHKACTSRKGSKCE